MNQKKFILKLKRCNFRRNHSKDWNIRFAQEELGIGTINLPGLEMK